MLCTVLFTVGFLLSVSVGETEWRNLYVKPSPTSSGCPQDEECMILWEYLQNVSDYFTSNTAFHFLPGNHTVENSEPSHLGVSGIPNLSLSGSTDITTLHCTERFGLFFVNVKELRISDIKIINCGQTVIAYIPNFEYMYSERPMKKVPEKISLRAALTLVDIRSLVLHNV